MATFGSGTFGSGYWGHPLAVVDRTPRPVLLWVETDEIRLDLTAGDLVAVQTAAENLAVSTQAEKVLVRLSEVESLATEVDEVRVSLRTRDLRLTLTVLDQTRVQTDVLERVRLVLDEVEAI